MEKEKSTVILMLSQKIEDLEKELSKVKKEKEETIKLNTKMSLECFF